MIYTSLDRNSRVISILTSRQPRLVASYAYLLLDEEGGILIDPGSRNDFAAVFSAVEAHLPLEQLRYIVLTSESPDTASSLPLWHRTGFNGQAVVSWRAYLSVQYYDDTMNFLTLKSNGEAISLGTRRLEFLHLPGLPSLGSVCCWDPREKILFSGELFGTIQGGEEETSPETLLTRMSSYHEIYLPRMPENREREALNGFNPQRICPHHGEALEIPFEELMSTFSPPRNGGIELGIEEPAQARARVLGRIRARLEQLFPKAEVSLVLPEEDQPPKEMSKSAFDAVFQTILQQKGYTWLALIDTEIRQLCSSAGIEAPAVYTSHRQEIAAGIDSLLKEIRHLRDTNFQLQQSIIETSDDLLRDETTGLYNETFFNEYVGSTVQGGSAAEDSVIFLRLDDIKRLNERYGSDAIDRTLQALAYFLMNRKHETAVLFRLSGPTFALYLHNQAKDSAEEYAEELMKEVARSEEFLTAISISAAVTNNQELIEREVSDEKFFTELMRLGKERLKIVDRMGPGSICASSEERSYRPSSGTVLLIESNDFEASLYTRILENAGFAVHHARHGTDALTRADEVRPDVIISEIFVSQMDGFQIRRRLLESQDLRRIPFILISREKSESSIRRGFEMRVTRQFQKPILPAELTSTIESLIEERERLE